MRWFFKKNKELRMVGVLIVSHGGLAEALISSVQFFVGNLQKIRGVSIWPKDKGKEVRDRIQKEIEEVDDGDGVVILTDVLGGTPTNLSLSFLKEEKVEVVTGVNMAMLLTLSSYRKGRSLREIGKLVKKSGRRSIVLAKALVRRREKKLMREKIKVN
jgi:PTS system mannose-specific IIA component